MKKCCRTKASRWWNQASDKVNQDLNWMKSLWTRVCRDAGSWRNSMKGGSCFVIPTHVRQLFGWQIQGLQENTLTASCFIHQAITSGPSASLPIKNIKKIQEESRNEFRKSLERVNTRVSCCFPPYHHEPQSTSFVIMSGEKGYKKLFIDSTLP